VLRPLAPAKSTRLYNLCNAYKPALFLSHLIRDYRSARDVVSLVGVVGETIDVSEADAIGPDVLIEYDNFQTNHSLGIRRSQRGDVPCYVLQSIVSL
jgi:hypothetical protein